MRVFVVNAFVVQNMGGNPAGVVLLDAPCSDMRMQSVAAEVGFSETAFVHSLSETEHSIRFFTPTKEVDLCGHATIASYRLLLQERRIEPGTFHMHTKAGMQHISVAEDGIISMSQNPPIFGSTIPKAAIAPCLGIQPDQFHPNLPVQIASTGLYKIFAPIASLVDILSIRPNYDQIERISRSHDAIGIYCYTLESLQFSTAHCRNFAPVVGILEDSATGTSAAALGCLLHHLGVLPEQETHSLTFEQGYSINVPSELQVNLRIHEGAVQSVQVAGRAVVVRSVEIE